LDSNQRLIYAENNKYINLDDLNNLSFTNQPTINSIFYDVSTNTFTDQDRLRMLVDVLKYLGVNEIPYLTLNWIAPSEVIDISNNYFTKTSVATPAQKYSIKSQKITGRDLGEPIYLKILDSGQTLFECGQCDVSSSTSVCFFYVDHNNRLLSNINGISYTFLTFDGTNIGSNLIPNIFSIYLQRWSTSNSGLVIQTRSYPSFPSKTLEINRITNICETIKWIEIPSSNSRLVIY
jgi:hypothetical protein